jgi:hypothetical protein
MSYSLDDKNDLSEKKKPEIGTRRKTIKKIIGKPLSKFITSSKHSLNNTFGRIPYIQGKQIHVSSSKKDSINPFYEKRSMYGNGKRSKKNKNKNKTRKYRKYK